MISEIDRTTVHNGGGEAHSLLNMAINKLVFVVVGASRRHHGRGEWKRNKKVKPWQDFGQNFYFYFAHSSIMSCAVVLIFFCICGWCHGDGYMNKRKKKKKRQCQVFSHNSHDESHDYYYHYFYYYMYFVSFFLFKTA